MQTVSSPSPPPPFPSNDSIPITRNGPKPAPLHQHPLDHHGPLLLLLPGLNPHLLPRHRRLPLPNRPRPRIPLCKPTTLPLLRLMAQRTRDRPSQRKDRVFLPHPRRADARNQIHPLLRPPTLCAASRPHGAQVAGDNVTQPAVGSLIPFQSAGAHEARIPNRAAGAERAGDRRRGRGHGRDERAGLYSGGSSPPKSPLTPSSPD